MNNLVYIKCTVSSDDICGRKCVFVGGGVIVCYVVVAEENKLQIWSECQFAPWISQV